LEPSSDTGELTLELPQSAVPADLVEEDQKIGQLMANTRDLCAVAETDIPKPAESLVRLVLLLVDLPLHLAIVLVENALHLNRDQPAPMLVPQVVRALPAGTVPPLDLHTQRRLDVLRRKVSEGIGISRGHPAQARACLTDLWGRGRYDAECA